MRSSVYVYVLLALTGSLTLAAPLSASERRFVLPPGVPPPALPPIPIVPSDPPPINPDVPPSPPNNPDVPPAFPPINPDVPPVPRSPPIIKDPLDGMGPGPVIPGAPPGKPAVERAEERREFSHVADQSNQDVPAPPDSGAFRVKRVDGALLPVPGQADHPFFPLPPDLDPPVDLPTPILDRDDQTGFADFLNKFHEARPNFIFDRGVDKDRRRNYVDALHDLLQGAGTL